MPRPVCVPRASGAGVANGYRRRCDKKDIVIVRRAIPTVQPPSIWPPPIRPPAIWGPVTGRTWRALPVAFLLLFIGCQPSPELLQADQQSCQRGSAAACERLAQARGSDAQENDIAPPVRSRDIVRAILAGM